MNLPLSTSSGPLSEVDPSQVIFMNEELILVDDNDTQIGTASKLDAHLSAKLQLHRAFSLFLFDSKHRLLIQRRAAEKPTFPLLWANTCCSHPLAVPHEQDGVSGVKSAIQRKLQHELGISRGTIQNDLMFNITKFLYKANSSHVFGEYELDYVVVAFINAELDPYPNPSEVCEAKWVTKDELQKLMSEEEEKGRVFAPWFRIICETFMFNIWSLLSPTSMENFSDEKIHNLIQN
ncbi:hypothetical protein RCL1_009118 [Eukaryota sp. TZLM3-RCL]